MNWRKATKESHEAANGAHNYWHVAANLIQVDVESKT